jgi:crotonobetaine/carnitine-CoA ligase
MRTVSRIDEVQANQPPREMSNRELWRWRVRHSPDSNYLRIDGRAWTYAELDDDVRRLAGGLRELGVGPGSRALVGMSNRAETVVAHLALAQLQTVIVPLVTGMPWEELEYRVRHSHAGVLIADDEIASMAAEHRDECPSLDHLIVVGDAETGGVHGEVRFEQLRTADPISDEVPRGDDLQALSQIIYTSGSTGRPKGVMLKAGSYYSCGLGYTDTYCFDSDDVYFHPLTFGHSLGANAAIGIPMFSGGSLAVVERFRPSLFWSQVAESGATVSVLFPAHLNLLLETAASAPAAGESSMRMIVTHTDIPAFRERFGVELATVWGMTETLICVGSEGSYRGQLGPAYVGRPFPGGELGVFDESFRRLGPYEHGELALRHSQAMIGYLDDPEATAATLVDSWVRSGDRGYIDHSGRAYFAGRYKAMIKRSGENISSEEVEAALLVQAGVAESAVVAVPDRIRTEEVGAVVVRRAGAEVDAAAVREACARQLVRWKLPRYIVLRDEPLPRLANGKIDRIATARLIDPASAWDADAVAQPGRT